MSNFHIIGNVRKESSLLKNSAVVHHQVKEKRIRTIGNINCNGAPITTTATTSSAKFSIISSAQGKSVVSSLSMSLERKDSVQYMPQKIVSCAIPAGQNTFVHLDNYTHLMAQRVTTKTIKRAEIIRDDAKSVVPSLTSVINSEEGGGIVDIDLKVVLGGVDSYHSNNNKTREVNKQKLQDSKSTLPSKMRGRKNSLGFDSKNSKEINKTNKIKNDKPDNSTALLNKTKSNIRKKVIKNITAKKRKIKASTGTEQAAEAVISKDTAEEDIETMQKSPSTTQPTGESKILRPCVYTLQSKKCLTGRDCPYLHSDFPCKYYYLNIPCPQDSKCQFMHNGPLKPELKEALRSHILDLLSTNPSAVETYFVQQIHYIDDLSHRLQYFQLQPFRSNQNENIEVIEVMDDGDDDLVLVIDESCNDCNAHNINDNTARNSLQDADQSLVLPPKINNLDEVFENIKETNTTVNEIYEKQKFIKTKSNMSSSEKINELQNIYDLLKEQEKRLKINENLNRTANVDDEQPNVVLVNPNIVNDIHTSECEANLVITTDDEDISSIDEVECSEATTLKVPEVAGTEFVTNEEENTANFIRDENTMSNVQHDHLHSTNANVPQQDGIEVITIDRLPQPNTDDNNAIVILPNECEINDLNIFSNMDYEEGPTTSIETISDNTNLNVKENYENMEESSKVTQTLNSETIESNEVDTRQSECDDTKQTIDVNFEKNKSAVFDKNESLTLHYETLEIEMTNDEKGAIENNIKEIDNKREVEEKSPPYEDHLTTNSGKRCLRSHTLQDNEKSPNKVDVKELSARTPEPTRPYRSRRLRLPKPIKKATEKSNVDECQIDGDILNKIIKSKENCSKESTLVQDVEAPLTQNVILTKRYMKRVKIKIDQQSLIHETKSSQVENSNDTNLEQKMLDLHSEDIESLNSVENTDDNNSVNLSQVESDRNIMEIDNSDIATSSDKINKNESLSGSCKLPVDYEKKDRTIKNKSSKRRISFETPTPSLSTFSSTTIKEKFQLRNPQVKLTKLKAPFILQTNEKDISADSTTHANPIVSSSTLLADNKSKQKRRILTADYDFESSPKENKCLKIDNAKSVRKVKIDTRERTLSQQSYDSKDGDFEIDSSDEKLTMASSYTSNEQEEDEAFEPSSTREQQHHQNEHKEIQENESDLRQQIENVSNKSDLQLQTQQQEQQQQFQQQIEVEQTSTTTVTSFKTKNSKNLLPHKQYQEHEKMLVDEEKDEKDLVHCQQYQENETEEGEITNSGNSCDSIENGEDGVTQSLALDRSYKAEKIISNSRNKYSNEVILTEEEDINVEYSTYSSLLSKLSNHSTKRPINFENSSVNITPISSPTHDNDTIASPSPIRNLIDFRMGGEVDGRLTYPPIPYILYEIDLQKIDINKPHFIDKLKKTLQLDPRIFRTHVKRQSISLSKAVETTSNALLPIKTSSTFNMSSHRPSSFTQQTAASMISPYDPRNRTPGIMTDITTPSLPHQTALTSYNSRQTTVASSSASLSSSFFHTGIPNAVPIALQYHSISQPIIQPQQQQTPNMFLYGCLQRSSWYQSLMSVMKIQINQSISQLVRALNNFHRERAFNPEMVFDVFKIDCAGELLEIMRNLGVFVDAHGVINEQRPVPSIDGHSCCNEAPVNASYSFIQQFLTPNTHCTSLATAGTPAGQLNPNEPILSCYVKAPEPPVHKHSDDCVTTHQSQHDDNNCNRNCNNKRNDNSNNNYNPQNNKRRYNNNNFKKHHDNNNDNNNYQQRSNQRSSYNNNNYNNKPRFMKPGSSSPTRLNSSPNNSPKKDFDGGNGGSYVGAGRRGDGGRFKNNKRFNNYNNTDNNNEKRYNNKYQSNDSTSGDFRPNSPFKSGSPRAGQHKTSSPPAQNNLVKAPKPTSTDEECWDSDN